MCGLLLYSREELWGAGGGLLFGGAGRTAVLGWAEGWMLAAAKRNSGGRFRNQANSPGTHDAFPAQSPLRVGVERRPAS